MKLRVTIFCLIFLLALTATAGKETITLSTGEWPPYTSESFKYGGLMTHITTQAFAEAGVDANYVYMPWKRALADARKGDYDGTIAWRKTPEREKDFLFSDPLAEDPLVFFHRKGSNFDWETLDDIGSLRVGVTLGYMAGELMKDPVKRGGGRLDVAPNDILSFQKLVRGRVDVVPASLSVGYYILQTEFLPGTAQRIRHHPKEITSGNLYLLIPKARPGADTLITRFNQGLRKLKETGRYEHYLDESIRGDYLPE